MAMGGFNPGQRGQIYDDTIANGATAVTTLTTMNVGVTGTSGAYTPKAAGYLLKIAILIAPQAASSLAQTGWITLSSTSFQPINTVTIAFTGFGLATAPQAQNPPPFERNLNLPVVPSLAITAQYIYQYSPVTPAIWIQGTFWASGKVATQ